MKDKPHILRALARRYERTQAGRTGEGERDLLLDYHQFLADAERGDGEARVIAERELEAATRKGIITLVAHRRDPRLIQQIRFSARQEDLLFAELGEPSPKERREQLARQFSSASHSTVPIEWRESWLALCDKLQSAARSGGVIAPFSRDDMALNKELLELVPRLLNWRGESLIRFASSVLCRDSKRLEMLAGKLEQILRDISAGTICSLESLGILANPRFVLVYGPLQLVIGNDLLDLSCLRGPFRLAGADIINAAHIRTAATRCLTIENETTFHELASLRSGELLVQTSFPGSATLALLTRLPSTIEFWHFGDTDPEGFEILRDLRERTGRAFRALHMRFRQNKDTPALSQEERAKIERLLASPKMETEQTELSQMLRAGHKGDFEQEIMGKPDMPIWPFYSDDIRLFGS
jgi:Uncharacterized protein conserved in bacteria C-term(DUF2220)